MTSGALSRMRRKRALLEDIGSVGGFAGREQNLARLASIGFGADGEDPQCAAAKPAENGIRSRKEYVVFDRHEQRPRSRHEFVAAGFGDQDGGSGGILLDLLP